jgi:fused signal recognition particle receptor
MSIFGHQEQTGYLSRLKQALSGGIGRKFGQLLSAPESPITESQLESIEALLLGADIGFQTTADMLEKVRAQTRGRKFLTTSEVRRMIRQELAAILRTAESPAYDTLPDSRPYVVFVVGVNGVGKTTTIGKLAHLFAKEGRTVLICAADTFRAAAVDQLAIWSRRSGADMVGQAPGADPAAVLFDAVAACKARAKDVLIADTAGRLHTKSNLMQELDKMRRVAARETPGAPHQVLLVLDATTGQNALVQAREFLARAGVTGIVVTKLDGTAKGGMVVAIAKELRIPIRYLGVGEKLDDLVPFSADAFVDGLLAEEDAGPR